MTDSQEAQTARLNVPIRRSPSYPALDLKSAIDRVRVLYQAEKTHAAPIQTAVKHWGYKGPNGKSNSIISALKKYGLIIDQGSGAARKIQVTPAAVRILDHPIESERIAAIQKAALLPPIHSEMWAKHQLELPSDETWIWELKEDRDFTDVGARDFVKEYKATIAYAQLGAEAEEPDVGEDVGFDGGEMTEAEEDAAILLDLDDEDPPRQRSALMERALTSRAAHAAALRQEAVMLEREKLALASQTGMTSVPIPLPGGGSIVVQAAFPITEANWAYFNAVLTAMKPGLVDAATDANQSQED